jgi:SNF2 family DNA or RNA helicase
MERLEPIMIRKTKKEALPDLPPLTVIDRWVEMTAEQRKVYKEVKDGILENADGEFNYLEVLAQITRFQQVCDSPALLNEYLGKELPQESGKLNELPIVLEEINPGRNKVILFSQYKQMTDIIVKKLREWYPQYYTAYIAGGVSDMKRRDEQLRFQEDDNCRFIVITTAGNYGLDLYAGNYVIAFDETFNPQKMEQVYSRAHRNGQTNPVTAINFKTFDSYEERKAKMLESKRGQFAAVIDGDDEAFAKMFGAKELVELF